VYHVRSDRTFWAAWYFPLHIRKPTSSWLFNPKDWVLVQMFLSWTHAAFVITRLVMPVVQQISVFSRTDGRTDGRWVPVLIMQAARTSHVWRHTALFLSRLMLDGLNVLILWNQFYCPHCLHTTRNARFYSFINIWPFLWAYPWQNVLYVTSLWSVVITTCESVTKQLGPRLI